MGKGERDTHATRCFKSHAPTSHVETTSFRKKLRAEIYGAHGLRVPGKWNPTGHSESKVGSNVTTTHALPLLEAPTTQRR
jgi:hypothetical protein